MSPARLARPALALLLAGACAAHRPRVDFGQPDPAQPISSLSPEDDGAHPSAAPQYFEWWYYDASFDDGSTATVALYAAEMLSPKHRPAVLINLLDPHGQPHASYQGVTRDELTLGAPGEIRVAASSITRAAGGAMRVQASGKDSAGQAIGVDLTFTPEMPGFKLGDGIIRFDGKVALAWVVPMPRARVEGTITEGGVTRTVAGRGYHDHNWGELNLIDTMAYWYWGRLSTDGATVVYADVHFKPELGVPPFSFVVWGDGARIRGAVADASFAPLGVHELEAAGRDVPQGLEIRGGGGALSLELRDDHVLEADDFSRYIPWLIRPLVRRWTKPAYVRSLSRFELTLPDQTPRTGAGAITELMYINEP